MTRTKQAFKKGIQRKAPSGAQSAEAFLKNGSKNAAKALKKNAKQVVGKSAAKPSRVEIRSKLPKFKPRPRGKADPTLVVKEAVAQSKHQTYYEIVENTEKKKKLEFTVTNKEEPPPGFTFIPVGNPELTHACKEISREQECMIFVVSATGEHTEFLSDHTNRSGYHFRSTIVEEASASINLQSVRRAGVNTVQSSRRRDKDKNVKYPLPATQEEINAQADAAIRDLFPRIPNTDRREIIDHAFQLGQTFARKPVVGLQEDLSLPRRVQLAVIAHIRHNHTRYDKLLRETDWSTARATIEPSCLEILVKWRGDEETGRDQMDEVLREVVVISDSEDTDSEETGNGDDDELEEGEVADGEADPDVEMANNQPPSMPSHQQTHLNEPYQREIVSLLASPRPATTQAGSDVGIAHQHDTRTSTRNARKARKDERKGFKRYQAWNEAISRHQKSSDAVPFSRAQEAQLQTSQATFHAGEFIDLTESPRGEKVMSRPVMESSHFQPYEQRDTRYDRYENSPLGQPNLVIRDRASANLRPLPPLKSTLQDYLLPSIEEAPDRALEDRRNLPDFPRQSEVRQRLELEPSCRGLTLMSDGTYRDAYGVVRTEDGRRVIYIDENNREVPQSVESSRRYAGTYGEGSTSRTISLASGYSSTRYQNSSVTMDNRSHSQLNSVSTPGYASSDSHPDRPIRLENRSYGDLRDPSGTRHQQSSLKHRPELAFVERNNNSFSVSSQQGIVPRELEVYRPRLRGAAEEYGRRPEELSHVVRPNSLSRFSEKNHGVAHPEQFSHSSSQLHKSVVYSQNDFEEPILVSQRTGGTVHYFEEPSVAARSYYEDPLPPRKRVSAAQHGTSRRPVIEYIDLDRPLNDYGRNAPDQYSSHNGADVDYGMIPKDQTRTLTHDRAPLYNSRVPPPRQYVA